MDRRDFLKKTGHAVALAAVTGSTGYLFHNRIPQQYHPLSIEKVSFEVAANKKFPVLSLSRNDDPLSALRSSLEALGGIARFVERGDRVTIKPNVGWDRTAEQAANTNPILVGEMVRICLQAGASRVIVTDVTCNDPRRCFIRSGIREAAEKAGAEVLLPENNDYVDVDIGGQMLGTWPVLRHFVDTDRLINMPIVKQHSLSRCTIGMKNLYGILGGRRHQLHQRIDQSIVDLAAFGRPTLTVVDATRVLLRNGPQGGLLDDVEIHNTVMCATDQVAADARGAEYLGLDPARVRHIVLAEESGLGMIDYRNAGYQEIQG